MEQEFLQKRYSQRATKKKLRWQLTSVVGRYHAIARDELDRPNASTVANVHRGDLLACRDVEVVEGAAGAPVGYQSRIASMHVTNYEDSLGRTLPTVRMREDWLRGKLPQKLCVTNGEFFSWTKLNIM